MTTMMTKDELDTLRKTVRDFCDREVRPSARDRDRTEAFPTELMPGLIELGVIGSRPANSGRSG